MLIVENPVLALIIALCVLIFFKLLFAILNKLDSKKAKSKPKEKPKDEKKETKVIETKKTETDNTVSKDSEKNEDIIVCSGENYLYDRFVTNPTKEDKLRCNENVSSAFIDPHELEEIRDRQIKIDVTPVKTLSKEYEIAEKLQELSKERNDKEKLLKDFNSLSKEMKMFIIENILSNMD